MSTNYDVHRLNVLFLIRESRRDGLVSGQGTEERIKAPETMLPGAHRPIVLYDINDWVRRDEGHG